MNVVPLLRAAGLTGRGGAAFPTADKVALARAERAGLIVNACDGEVGSMKDAYVVSHHLEELVDGVGLVGLRRTRFAAHRGSRTEQLLRRADLDVLSVPRRYVASEESALASLAAGGSARPISRWQPIVRGGKAPDGRRVRPTLVLNAETVWRISQIADRGADWFRSYGTSQEPGPALASVLGAVAGPGVYEVAAGMPLRQLVESAGGSLTSTPGVNVGGLGGGWLSPVAAESATYSRAGLAALDCAPGAGVVRVLDDRDCPLVHVQRMVAYAAGESAGQCGPCMFGLTAVAEDIRVLTTGMSHAATWRRAHERLTSVTGRGACRFPDGVARYTTTALRVFSAHLAEHGRGGCTLMREQAS